MTRGGVEATKRRILDFWFGDLRDGETPPSDLSKMWWASDLTIDEYIRNNFEADLIKAVEENTAEWEETPSGTLALIILLDQFSRNIYRENPRAFSQDPQALEIAARGIRKGFDKALHPVMRIFFYMPFVHSEDIGMQKRSLDLFRGLEKEFGTPPELAEMLSTCRDYAERHYAVVERFGRYPHRNRILGRQSTPEEVEFLKQPGSSF